MRKFIAGFFLAAATTGALVACGGDDQYIQPGNTGDGGTTDGGKTGDGGTTDGAVGDGGDAGPCAFTAFVIDQVQNQTKDTTQPVQTANIPDPTCSIDNASAFTPLFP